MASATPTQSQTCTSSAPPTASPTATALASATPTQTQTRTASAPPTASPTPTASAQQTATPTVPGSATPTPTGTAGASLSPTATPGLSGTATPTLNPNRTRSATPTPTPAPTASAPPTGTPPPTASATASPTPTPTPTPTPSPTTTATATATATPSTPPTATPSGSAPVSRTPTPTRSGSAPPTASATPTASAAPTPTSTPTPTPLPTAFAALLITTLPQPQPQPHPATEDLLLQASIGGTPTALGCRWDWDANWTARAIDPHAPPPHLQAYGFAARLVAAELQAPSYTITITASPRTPAAAGPAPHVTSAVTVHIQRPLQYTLTDGAGPLTVAAVAGGAAVRLTAAASGWSPAPAALQYLFVLLTPEGLVLPLPQALNFAGHPELQLPLPTLPTPGGGASTYTFALMVRDGVRGPAAGPFPAGAPTTAPAPPYAAACGPPRGLLAGVACGVCGAPAPPYRPDQDVVQHLAALTGAPSPAQRLAVLHEVALLARRFPPGPAPGFTAGGAAEVAALLVNATAPLLGSADAASVLWDALGELLPRGAPGLPTALALMRALLGRHPLCAPHTAALISHDRRWQAIGRRLVAPAPPPSLVALPAHGITVALPGDLPGALANEGVLDVIVMASPPAGPLVTPVVTVLVTSPVTGAEIPLAGPITLDFGTLSASPRYAPTDAWYRCLALQEGEWRADEAQLAPEAPVGTYVCHMSGRASVAVEQVCAHCFPCGLPRARHTYTRTHSRARTHAHTHTLTRTHSRTHTHTHSRARTHAHTHTHTHAHARTHTHTHTFKSSQVDNAITPQSIIGGAKP